MLTRAGGTGGGSGEPCLLALIRNEPRELQARDKEGGRLTGIPYDYSELVFDLFFTIESFPTPNADEEWTDGTELYVVRKLLTRMGAMVANRNIVDYLGDAPKTYVQFAVAFPLRPA